MGAGATSELWSHVDDFDWHKVQASPNWSVLPASQRPVQASHDTVTLDWAPHAAYTATPVHTPSAAAAQVPAAGAPAASDGVSDSKSAPHEDSKEAATMEQVPAEPESESDDEL